MIEEAFLAAMPSFVLGAAAVLFRLLGFLMGLPIFYHRAVPMRIKVALLLHLTAVILVATGFPRIESSTGMLGWTLVIGGDFLFGLALGMVVRMAMYVAEGAAQLVGMSIGLGFAMSVDPATGAQSTALGQLLSIAMMLIFIAADLHLTLIGVIGQTFVIFEPGAAPSVLAGGVQIASLGADLLAISLRLAAPVVTVGLMIYLVLGVMTRVAPQLNLFVVGFPILLAVGLATLAVSFGDSGLVMLDILQALPARIEMFAMEGVLR